jgi:hypothetical protein
MHARISGALAAGPDILGKEFSGADVLVASMGQFVRTFCRRARSSMRTSRAVTRGRRSPARWRKIAAEGYVQPRVFA